MIIHYINHNFTDWDSQTKHMSRIEKSIFLDLRTMYFGNASRSNGNIDGNDFELLCYRLSCKTEEEINALKLLLKDQFKKIGKFYRNADWDRQIKNLDWWYQNNGNTGNELGNGGNAQGNESGNAMSNAERQAKAKQERKNIITALSSINIEFDKKAPIATLRALFADNFGNDEIASVVTQIAELGNTGNESGKEIGNGGNAEIRANNHKPRTINQEPLTNNNTHTQQTDDSQNDKAEQIRLARSQEIQDWQAPTLDSMRQELSQAGFMGILTEDIYQTHIKDFKAHYAEQALVGKPLNTDSLRKSKLRLWIQSAKPPKQAKPSQKFGSTDDPLAVNQKWRPGETGIVAPNTNFEFIDGQLVATPLDTSSSVQGAW